MESKKTALYDSHVAAGGKMVDFAGYAMPVQYTGINEEHHCVRQSVGIFDVSHMGEFFIRGENALAFLQKVTINDVSKLEKNRAQYTAMCLEDGGIIDDLIIYSFGDTYMVIVNASNLQKDYNWLKGNILPDVTLEDKSDDFCLFAVQGRNAEKTLQKIADVNLSEIKFYWFHEGRIAGKDAFIARTGYTGEDGFEIGVSSNDATEVWQSILDAGTEFKIQPIGLAARDTLRLEMKYCLYGNDIHQTTNPIEAGLGWITKTDKGDFIGRDAILKVKENGAVRKLVGLVLQERAIPRHGYKIEKDGAEIGFITSGTFSPSLGKGICLGYVNVPHNGIGSQVDIVIRNKNVAAEIVKTPFYNRPY